MICHMKETIHSGWMRTTFINDGHGYYTIDMTPDPKLNLWCDSFFPVANSLLHTHLDCHLLHILFSFAMSPFLAICEKSDLDSPQCVLCSIDVIQHLQRQLKAIFSEQADASKFAKFWSNSVFLWESETQSVFAISTALFCIFGLLILLCFQGNSIRL